jgi:hypothetical protein
MEDLLQSCTEQVFLPIMEARNRFQGIDSASLCSLAGRYENPIPTRYVQIVHSLYKNSSSELDPVTTVSLSILQKNIFPIILLQQK